MSTTKNTTKQETTQSENYLRLWAKNEDGKFRPVIHQFEQAKAGFSLNIRKNKEGANALIDIYYEGKEGPMVLTLGASGKELSKIWSATPVLANSGSSEIVKH